MQRTAPLQVVLLLDVDFLVTAGVHSRLSGVEAAAGLAADTGVHRQAIVLPAFETGPDLGVKAGSAAAASAVAGEQHSFHTCKPLALLSTRSAAA